MIEAERRSVVMHAEVENQILAHLREIRGDVAEIKADLRTRGASLERGQAETRVELSHIHKDMAGMHARIDR